jgi:hypothetical protein
VLTLKATTPEHLGNFTFNIKRSGGLHLATENTLSVIITCKDCCEGIKFEEAGVAVKTVT